MTEFEAATKKDYLLNGELITAYDFIVAVINTDWIYSSHWEPEIWKQQAIQDCNYRIKQITAELNDLNKALKLLNSIE